MSDSEEKERLSVRYFSQIYAQISYTVEGGCNKKTKKKEKKPVPNLKFAHAVAFGFFGIFRILFRFSVVLFRFFLV